MHLRALGLLAGLSGLVSPGSQYESSGLNPNSAGKVIPGLLGSASLPATYTKSLLVVVSIYLINN